MNDLDTAKWMVNILKETRHRERYVKMLEKLTPHPYVTYSRIMMSAGLLVGIMLITVILLIQPGTKLKYTAVWVVLGCVSALALVAIYAMPHRQESLISTSMRMLSTNTISKLLGTKSRINTIGVENLHYDQGSTSCLIEFTNGDVGTAYKIDGGVGISTLPAVAKATRKARYQYLIARSETAQETLITQVVTAKFTEQLRWLKHLTDRYAKSNDPADKWRKYMAGTQYDFIHDNMRENDTVIEQYLILREENVAKLMSAKAQLNNAVASGMLTSAIPMSEKNLRKLLADLTASALTK